MSDPNQAETITVNLTVDLERLKKALPDHDTSEGKAKIRAVLIEALATFADGLEHPPPEADCEIARALTGWF